MKITSRFAPLTLFCIGFLSLNAWAAPKIQSWQTPQGTSVYFVESHALPIIDLNVSFPAGEAYEPPEKAGLAGLTLGLLDAGAGSLTQDQISDRFADVGAIASGAVEADRAMLGLRTLSSPRERDLTLETGLTILGQPTFPEAVLTREKTRELAQLKEALTKPSALAARAFAKDLYGTHPYAHLVTEETLSSITREDLVQFYQARYRAANATIALVGDLTLPEAQALAQRIAAVLPQGPAANTTLATPAIPAAKTERISNPSNQAHILIGLPGISREDPDYFPLLVGNYTLGGGGFASRLMKEIREKRGLAYHISSNFEPRQVPGPFEITLQTKGSQRDEALGITLETVRNFIQAGPTAAELKAAKDNYVNGFGLRLDSNRKLMSYLSLIAYYKLPLDWLETYPQKIEAVTAEQVKDAWRRRVDPEHFVTVVVGGDGNISEPNAAE